MEKYKGKFTVWDNRMDTLKEFKDECYWYYKGTSRKDRETVPHRIIQRLTGDARKVIQDLPRGKARGIKGMPGLEFVLRTLEDTLFEMTIPELQENMNEYFNRMHRKQGETMRVYVARAKRMHDKLQRAIAVIEKKHRRDVTLEKGIPARQKRGYG